MVKSFLFKTYLGIYIPTDKICAFGDDGEGGYGIEVISGAVYDADKKDIDFLRKTLGVDFNSSKASEENG